MRTDLKLNNFENENKFSIKDRSFLQMIKFKIIKNVLAQVCNLYEFEK
jgi:hypothetical protein